MVQTRIASIPSRTAARSSRWRARSIGLRANYVLQPDLRNFEAMYFYGGTPIVNVRIVAKLVRMPDRQIIGVATFQRCVEGPGRQSAKGRRGFRPGAGQRHEAVGLVDAAPRQAAG